MNSVDNSIYQELGSRWYESQDNPVALLRAESQLRNPWIFAKIKTLLGRELSNSQIEILDVGCGGGFLSNYLAKQGYSIHAIDLSESSLQIARKYDETSSVHYSLANAAHLPFKSNTFDVVTAMDFLEHVENPEIYIAEISRVLRPGGVFFFHTFNRNLFSWLLVIKAVEIFVRNTPKNMHILRLFIKPFELKKYCHIAKLEVREMKGLKPNLFNLRVLLGFLKRVVSSEFTFSFTDSLKASYCGYAIKIPTPIGIEPIPPPNGKLGLN